MSTLEQNELRESSLPAAPRYVRLPERVPYVVYTLIGLTLLTFALQYLTQYGILGPQGFRCPYFFTRDVPACYGLKVNGLIIDGQWWRLLTPIFLHASLIHIGFNMYALNILGPELEQHFGHWQFLSLYLLGGFAGVVLSFLFTESASLGASTSVFGLLAAQGVFAYRNQRVFGPRARAALRSILNIAAINFLIGLTVAQGIDNWGHFGGLVGGLIFAAIAAPVYELRGTETELKLANRTPPDRMVIASVVVGASFAVLALGEIYFGFNLPNLSLL